MIESHAVLEVSDGIFDLGVAAMVGLQLQGLPVPVGDEAVIAVGGEEGEQRVIAPIAGIAPVSSTGQAVVACALLGQTVGLADGGIEVDGERRVAGSGPGLPCPCQQLVVDAVAANQRRRNQDHHLVSRVRPARGAAEIEVMVYEFPQAQAQAQAPGQGGWKDQPGVGYQAVVVEGDTDAVGVFAW